MKKLLIALAFVGMSSAAMAQETPTEKYSVATNGFWHNWYIQAAGNYSAFYSNEETGLGLSKSPFKGFRSTPGFSVAVGKRFTPVIGLRTKFYGINGLQVAVDETKKSETGWNLQEQVTFNLNNLFCGYRADRVWNLTTVLGTGINDFDSNLSMSWSGAINSSWKLSKRVDLFVEAGVLFNEHDADNIGANGTSGSYWGTHDKQVYAEVGLTVNLGKTTWEKTPDLDAINAMHQAQIDALTASLADAEAEAARLKALLANHKCPTPTAVKATVQAATAASVFFNIGKSTIASKKDLVNVQEIANIAKENDSKIVVTGYADSATGSVAFNQQLSEKRANTVADALVEMGVDRDNITTVAEGGVDTLSPISYNRRATVKIAD